MMNTFNTKRFGLLLRKDFLENGKRYLLQFLTMFGIITVVFLLGPFDNFYELSISHSFDEGDYEFLVKNVLTTVIFLFLIFGTLFAATMMEPMRDKTKRIMYLANPSSNFEKVLSRWLIVTIGYVVAFFVAFWLADAIRVTIFSIRYPELDIRFLDFGQLFPTEGIYDYKYVLPDRKAFIACLMFFSLMQSLFMLGSTFWPKGTFIKTFSAMVLVVVLFLLLCSWAIWIGNESGDQFSRAMESSGIDDIPKELRFPVIAGIFGSFTVVNWTLAFFRFRESEIIKRL